MNDMANKTWKGQPLPCVVVKRIVDKQSMEVVAVRFTLEQIETIDKMAMDLGVSRAAFLRNFYIHMLNLPVNGKCQGDDIFGELK